MENKEIVKKANELLEFFTAIDVHNVNHKPHAFMIGPRHVAHVADHNGGMLGEKTMEEVPCAHPGCQVSYDQHVSDKVLFLELKQNITEEQAPKDLGKLREMLDANGIVGISLVETEEKYRVESKE